MMILHRFLYGLLFLTALVVSPAAAQLQPGDIVVIGVQSDGTDQFAWVPLVDLLPGQEVYFTDAGWNAEAQAFQRQVNAASDPSTTSPSGGAIKYTVPPEGLKTGTVVEVQINSRSRGEPGEYSLAVTGASADDFSAANDTDVVGDQGLSIATTGDQLLVLTGTLLHPSFIFGVNTGADQWDLGSTTAQHSSDLPAGLMDGLTALAIGVGPDGGDEVDNGRYTGPAAGTRETILSAIADRGHWETSDTAFDDLTSGRSILDIITTSPTPVVVALDTIFVAPGDIAWIPITIINTTNRDVGFLQFRLILKGQALFTQEPVGGIPEDLNMETISADGESLTVFVTPRFEQEPIIAADTIRIIGHVRVIPDGEALGKTVGVHILEDTTFIIRDINDFTLMTSGSNGAVQVGIRGDINIDRRVNILDAASLVYRMLHGKLPAPATIGYHMADVNTDGLVNIADVIGMIRIILGLPLVDPAQARSIQTRDLAARLHTPRQIDDNQLGIPLSVSKGRHLAGLYATFLFDSSRLQVGNPEAVTSLSDLIIESVIHQDVLRIIAVSPTLSFFPTDDADPGIIIPVRLLTSDMTNFSLIELTLIDDQGRETEVILDRSHQTVKVGKQGPDAFALSINTPNPFNPRTEIAYQVPLAAHVALKVYNVLGQEVITLVDRKHTAGHYSAIWHAQNHNGEPVASGVYIYRLTSDSGYSEMRRMTVLK